MCIRIRLRSKFFDKLEPDTRSCWRRSNQIRLPSKLLEKLDLDTPSRWRSWIRIRLPWKLLEKLDLDTPALELLQNAQTKYPLLRTEYTTCFFTSLIPPSMFGHLHPLRHHHQHRSCSSINDCLALPLNHRPSTCNNHIKNGKKDYLYSTVGHSQANTSAHRLAQSSSKFLSFAVDDSEWLCQAGNLATTKHCKSIVEKK
ncbi:hypothetical protein V8G54_003868 [Vigna mungo]|uniref:Uncharacterized protein n=1 Tax=Vigna mungo TaxID=3915 RepID=A0AAQ3SEQ2_VIGMU